MFAHIKWVNIVYLLHVLTVQRCKKQIYNYFALINGFGFLEEKNSIAGSVETTRQISVKRWSSEP